MDKGPERMAEPRVTMIPTLALEKHLELRASEYARKSLGRDCQYYSKVMITTAAPCCN